MISALAVAAADKIDLQPTGEGWSNLGSLTIPALVTALIKLALTVAALLFFAMLVWGGVRWILSKGDQQQVEAARNQITHALIGLAIVFVAWAIAKLVGSFFGINDILKLDIPTVTVNQTGTN